MEGADGLAARWGSDTDTGDRGAGWDDDPGARVDHEDVMAEIVDAVEAVEHEGGRGVEQGQGVRAAGRDGDTGGAFGDAAPVAPVPASPRS